MRFDSGFGTALAVRADGGSRDLETWVADSIDTPVYLINPEAGGLLYGAGGDDEWRMAA